MVESRLKEVKIVMIEKTSYWECVPQCNSSVEEAEGNFLPANEI